MTRRSPWKRLWRAASIGLDLSAVIALCLAGWRCLPLLWEYRPLDAALIGLSLIIVALSYLHHAITGEYP